MLNDFLDESFGEVLPFQLVMKLIWIINYEFNRRFLLGFVPGLLSIHLPIDFSRKNISMLETDFTMSSALEKDYVGKVLLAPVSVIKLLF